MFHAGPVGQEPFPSPAINRQERVPDGAGTRNETENPTASCGAPGQSSVGQEPSSSPAVDRQERVPDGGGKVTDRDHLPSSLPLDKGGLRGVDASTMEMSDHVTDENDETSKNDETLRGSGQANLDIGKLAEVLKDATIFVDP